MHTIFLECTTTTYSTAPVSMVTIFVGIIGEQFLVHGRIAKPKASESDPTSS